MFSNSDTMGQHFVTYLVKREKETSFSEGQTLDLYPRFDLVGRVMLPCSCLEGIMLSFLLELLLLIPGSIVIITVITIA